MLVYDNQRSLVFFNEVVAGQMRIRRCHAIETRTDSAVMPVTFRIPSSETRACSLIECILL